MNPARTVANLTLGFVSFILALPLFLIGNALPHCLISILNGDWEAALGFFLLFILSPILLLYIMWKLYSKEMYVTATLTAVAIGALIEYFFSGY